MMKKLTALLLCLTLLCTLAAAESADLLGTWYLSSIVMEGVEMNPADMGIGMTITLNEDGTGTNGFAGADPLDATWTLDGATLTVTANEEPIEFEVREDGTLVNTDVENNLDMVFGREQPVASFIPAAAAVATDISQFDGTWTAEWADVYGALVPFSGLASLGITDASVVIENGVITKFGDEEAQTGTLEDGVLVIPSTIENDTENVFATSVTLLEDGTIRVLYLGIFFYCAAN